MVEVQEQVDFDFSLNPEPGPGRYLLVWPAVIFPFGNKTYPIWIMHEASYR
jgi:hypothetical protein